MKEKTSNRKTYEEELLWAIIIILMMFITTLDVFWYSRKTNIADTIDFAASSTVQVITIDNKGGTGGLDHIYIKDKEVYSDSSCTQKITSVPLPEKYGYKFAGYESSYYPVINEDGSINTTGVTGGYTGNYTITAQWEAWSNVQVITLDKNGSGSSGTPIALYVYNSVAYSDMNCINKITKVTPPTWSGYEFTEYSSSSYGKIIEKDGTLWDAAIRGIYAGTKSNYTASAQWEKLQFCYIDRNGGTGGTGQIYVGSLNVYSDPYGMYSITKVNLPTRTGYTASGSSYIDASGNLNTSSMITRRKQMGATNSITETIDWTPITYTIKYNGNGATGGSTANSSHTYDEAKKLTKNGYSLPGYRFTGWNTAANGSGTSYTDEQSVTNLSTTNGAVINLYAQWAESVYKITIDNDGGTGGPSELYTSIYVNGTSYSSPRFVSTLAGTTEVTSVTIPTKTGYTFNGYYSSGATSGVCVIDSKGKVNTSNIGACWSNKKITAQWTANTYTVKYNGNGSTGGSTADSSHTYDAAKALTANGFERKYTVTYNHNYTGSTNTSKTATYTFNGWATSASGAKVYSNSQSVKNLSSTNGATVNLYANWTSASVNYTPSRTGYTFGGWYKEAACTNKVSDATYTPTSNITVYAKWTANTYTIAYDGNGATGGNTANSSHTYDSAKNLTANGYTKTGYEFIGWNTKSDGSGTGYKDEESVVNQTATNGETITLYAQWKANTYTVTYDQNGATEFDGDTSKTVTYDTEYGTLPIVKREYTVEFDTKEGIECEPKQIEYTFDGWYLNESEVDKTSIVKTASDHKLTAKWTEQGIKLPETSKNGYEFIGWYTEEGIKVGEAGETYVPKENVKLIAHYEGKQYTLKVNPNGGKWRDKTEPQEIIGTIEDTITIEDPISPEGNKVVFVKNNGTEDEIITQTRTFQEWKLTEAGSITGNQYTYGAGDAEIIAQYSTNNSIKLPTAEKQGYTFEGWYSDVDLNTKIGNAEDNYVPEENTILYAKWLPNTSTEYKVEYYTEKLDGSYELNNTENLTGTTDSNVIAEIKEIAGFEYDESNTENVKQGMVKPDGSLTLKMYYTRKTLTVTLDVNEGNALENDTKQIKYEAEYGELPEPTKEGHTFIGWYDSKVDGNQIKTTTKLEKTEDHTLYAHWKVNTYTLTINPNGGEYNGNTSSSTFTQEYNSTKEIENPTKNKDGYKVTFVNIGGESVDPIVQTSTFTSWSLDGAGKLEKVDEKTIYTYGSENAQITANYTENKIVLPNATKEGNTFQGWKTINDIKVGEAGEEYLPTSDITLYAIYEENFYDLKIDPNGGKWNGSSEIQTVTGKYGSSYVIADPEAPQGYTVKLHLNTEDNETQEIIQTQTFEKWENDNGYGTLIGNSYQYGVGTDTLKAIYTRNKIELPNIEKTGYTLEGWYKDNALTDKIGEAGDEYNPEDNCELYAKWTANTYQITFDVNEGEELENNTKNVVYAEKYGELPTTVRAGYTFVGWFNEKDVEITAESIVDITTDITLVAKWTENELTVSLDVYKGQVEPQEIKVIYNHEYGELPTPTMEGCEFEGWYDSKEESANRVVDTSIVRKTEDHTLYAKWKDIQGPKFTYDENNIYEIEVHSEIPEFNVTATDNYDDDVDITITNNINKDVVGTYEYTITATDKAENTTTEKKQFKVVDTTKPVIDVKDNVNSYEIEVHGEKPIFLATATDNYDEYVEVVVTDDINVHKVGTYTVTFTAIDTNGNIATENREFKVVDTTKPVITLSDENVYEMEVYGEKPEFRATATDNYDDNIEVEITDDIKIDVVGTYTITFKATDTNGNVSTETREFKVKDTTLPVITLSEENVYEMKAFEEIPEFKATAIDNYDEEVIVEITNTIDKTEVGTYTVTFTATDKAGNEAKVTKEFKVLKAKPTYTIPTGIEARYIDTLADITLPEGFTFEDDLSTSVGPEGENTFKVTFTPKDLHNYEIITGIEIKIKVNYLNIDLDGDGKADLNIDTDGDGKADLNVDIDGDGKADLNVDTDGDGKADLNVDTDGDGKADLNVDTDGDGKADLNVDTDGDGKADLNVDTDGDGKADLNVDIDGDGKADLNIDTDGDGIPDKNVQKDEDKSDDPTNDEDEDIIYSNEDYTASNTYTKGNLSIYSSKYLFGNKYMENIQNKTTVEALKSWCVSNGTIEVYDKGGMLKKKDTDIIGTGTILKVTKDGETMSFVIVIQGDTSGDGIVTTSDAAEVKFHILHKKELKGSAFRAADVNRNKAVTGEDLATISRKLQYLEPEVLNPDYTEDEEDTKSDNTEAADNTENTKEEKTNTDSTENKNTATEEKDTEEKTDTTEDEDKNKTDNTTNKTNTTEQPENIDKKQEEVELPENDTVQYKKQEE